MVPRWQRSETLKLILVSNKLISVKFLPSRDNEAVHLRVSPLSEQWRAYAYICLLYKHQWNTKWAFPQKLHIFTHEDNMLSLHVKRSPLLWLHNKLHLRKQADLVFHWCLYNKQNITYLLMDMNLIFSCSTHEISSWPLEDKVHIHARACNILYILHIIIYTVSANSRSLLPKGWTVKGTAQRDRPNVFERRLFALSVP